MLTFEESEWRGRVLMGFVNFTQLVVSYCEEDEREHEQSKFILPEVP